MSGGGIQGGEVRRSDASLKNLHEDEAPPLKSGTITIYPERFEVFVNSSRVQLSLTQFRILSVMARRPGWVFSASQIRQALRTIGPDLDSASIKNHIYGLRQRLGRDGASQIQTVRGVGYRVSADAGPGEPGEQT